MDTYDIISAFFLYIIWQLKQCYDEYRLISSTYRTKQYLWMILAVQYASILAFVFAVRKPVVNFCQCFIMYGRFVSICDETA